MAKRNYLVEGLSGAGKSSVYEELVRRGYTAISTDRAWSYSADPDTGLRRGPIGHDTWMWDQQKDVSDEDDWPLGQEGVELMLELNRSGEGPAGAIDVDATPALNQVVDELLRLAGKAEGDAAQR